jgi:hypothetical protein
VSGRAPGLLARILRGWREIGSRAGFLALLVVLSAALGALVALPLWLFATARPAAYTVTALAAAGAAVVAAVARRAARRGTGWRRAGAASLAAALAVAKAALLVGGLAAGVAFAARGRPLPAAAGLAAFLAAAAWVGWGVRPGPPAPPPETDR